MSSGDNQPADTAADVAGFRHITQHLSEPRQQQILHDVRAGLQIAPLFQPVMPRSGRPLSVQMSNFGTLGWLSDRAGYRYVATHPETGQPWPPIPHSIAEVWDELLPDAPPPEACLVNWYGPKAKLGLHRDVDEQDHVTPVLSISLGDDAWFRIGGRRRTDPTRRMLLKSGDVVILGGDARLAYHGVDRIIAGTGTLLPDPGRINLTLRRVTSD